MDSYVVETKDSDLVAAVHWARILAIVLVVVRGGENRPLKGKGSDQIGCDGDNGLGLTGDGLGMGDDYYMGSGCGDNFGNGHPEGLLRA